LRRIRLNVLKFVVGHRTTTRLRIVCALTVHASAIKAKEAMRLQAHGANRDFSFVLRQNGMFSYSGLTAEQVDRLREEFHIYAVSTGRICVAALNSRNVDYVAKAITTVLQ
jgi:aspartate/tyrosine/aromatic aminotransferase